MDHRLSANYDFYPKYPGNTSGDLLDNPKMPHVNVNEGPEILQHGDEYFSGLLRLRLLTDYYASRRRPREVLRKSARRCLMVKVRSPFLSADREAKVFGRDITGFSNRPMARRLESSITPIRIAARMRTEAITRIQKFTWNADGSPDFGKPIATDTAIPKLRNSCIQLKMAVEHSIVLRGTIWISHKFNYLSYIGTCGELCSFVVTIWH